MGNLGWPEMIFIVIAALIIFGPRKLPEIARTLGGFMAQLRRASEEFKRTWESEVDRLDEADRKKPVPATISNLPESLAQEEVNPTATDTSATATNEIAIVPVAESVAKSAPNAAATATMPTVAAETSAVAATPAVAGENKSVAVETS